MGTEVRLLIPDPRPLDSGSQPLPGEDSHSYQAGFKNPCRNCRNLDWKLDDIKHFYVLRQSNRTVVVFDTYSEIFPGCYNISNFL